VPQTSGARNAPDINADVEEAADLGRNIGLEGAIAEDEREELQQEQRFECHHEMADRHEPGAKDHGAALTEHVIGKPASKEWSQ
jgi:hypothetical protein